jgi:hypothetical protein
MSSPALKDHFFYVPMVTSQYRCDCIITKIIRKHGQHWNEGRFFFSFSYKYIFFPENYVVGSLLLSFDRKKKSLVHNINLGQKCSYWPHMYICIQACVFCLLAKLDIFPLMCADDKVWITELTLIHKNIRSVCNSHISQSDVKHIMTSQIKTI